MQRLDIQPLSEQKPERAALRYRLGWLVAIWLGSVLALGIVAMGFHLLMHAAGLHS
ncbi:MAG: DUF2474 domain-containing protein [Pseudomonadota bacterium]|nr:DUF2474 domain-containing protein [Gallaecimonas pentaromativorans]MED5525114.1 DUF2474 domain-containing protein [Pseudomonadota bacterium]